MGQVWRRLQPGVLTSFEGYSNSGRTPSASLPQAAWAVLLPTMAAENRYRQLYDEIRAVVGDALGLDDRPVDEAMQLFEILRLELNSPNVSFPTNESKSSRLKQARSSTPNIAAEHAAIPARQKVIDEVAEHCHAYHTHLFAAERQYEAGRGRRWSSPVAERLADQIGRQGEFHPVIAGLQWGVTGAQLALLAVGTAVGTVARELEWRITPVAPGPAAFMPSEFWLDGPLTV